VVSPDRLTAAPAPRSGRVPRSALLPRSVLVLALLASACAPPAPAGPAPTPAPDARAAARSTAPPAPTQAAPTPNPDVSRLRVSTSGWKTDFTRRTVPLDEISSGGPPRDGIPPIDRPRFDSVTQADGWLKPQEPVVHLAVAGDARAYPLQILIWHEIVNDDVGGAPVVVTFCPLCNTAIAFDRRLEGRLLDFGTTGNLRHSDLVMWDRQTESWWQQITGEAIVGELAGARLRPLPAAIVSWDEFRRGSPGGRVLSRETGHRRDYGRNPYVGYDRIDQSPFLFQGKTDGRLPPMERVVTVSLGGEDAAYPLSGLRERRVVADTVGGRPIVVFYRSGTTSALDAAAIADSRDVGATAVYSPVVEGRQLTFRPSDDAFVDAETGTRWSLLGRATAGPLAGKQLDPIVAGNHFWFAWAVFKPETRLAG
jgi:hypothetical protein